MGSRSFRVHTCDLLISCSSEQFYSIKYAISVNFYIYTSFLQYITSIHYYYKVPSCIFFSFSFIFWRYCPSHHSLSNEIRRIHRVRTCQKICQDVADNDHTPFFIQNWQKVDFTLEFASFFVRFSSWLFLSRFSAPVRFFWDSPPFIREEYPSGNGGRYAVAWFAAVFPAAGTSVSSGGGPCFRVPPGIWHLFLNFLHPSGRKFGFCSGIFRMICYHVSCDS